MNPLKPLKLILALLCIGLASAVKAQTNKLYIPSVTIQKDRTVQIPVNVDNTSDIVAVQFTLQLPDQLALQPEGAAMNEDRSNGHEVIARKTGNNKYTFVVHSAQNNPIKGRTGTLLTVPLYGKDKVEEGKTYQITMTDAVLSVKSGRNVLTEQSAGEVFVDVSPDITVRNVRAEQSQAAPGQTINVSWMVENIGDRPTADGFQELVYLVNEHETEVYIGKTVYEENIVARGTVSRSAEFALPSLLGVSGEARVKVKLQPMSYNCEPREYASNNTALSDGKVSVSKFLLLSPENVTTDESAQQNVRFLLSRSGNNNANEDFMLTATADTRITLPSVVTIPRGQSGAYFYAQVKANKVIDNDSIVNIAISGNGYDAVRARLAINDDTYPDLTLTSKAQEINEGGSIVLTVSIDKALSEDLEVRLASDINARIELPASVVIPAGKKSVDVNVTAIDDNTPHLEEVVTFTASATKFNPASLYIALVDNDLPDLQLSITPNAVSEGAGPMALTAKLTRTTNIDKKITIKFSDDSNGNIHYSLQSFDMASGMKDMTVYLGPIDNNIVDGERTYNITAAVWIPSCSCSANIGTSGGVVSVPLTVYDNDGPTLSATASSSIMREGDEISVTVSRNTGTKDAIDVRVSSDNDPAFEYPSVVTIPAGESSVSFKVKARGNDVAGDGFTAMFTFQSSGFVSAALSISVSDLTMADAKVDGLALSKSEVRAGETVTATVSLSNVGNYELPATTKVDFHIDGISDPIGTRTLSSPLAMGASMEVALEIVVPATIGEYRMYARVNADQTVPEISMGNNMSQYVPLAVLPPYTATVFTDKKAYKQGETIGISGKISGSDVANKDVEVYVINEGYRQSFTVATDASGSFGMEFTPITGQMGHFSVGACYPSESKRGEMAGFDIYGLKLSAPWSQCDLVQNEPFKGSLTVTNPCAIPQNEITVAANGTSDNCGFDFSAIGKLGAGESAVIECTIDPRSVSAGSEYQILPVAVASKEGASVQHTIYYYVLSATGKLHSNTTEVNTTVTLNAPKDYPVVIRNIGKGETGTITFALPSFVTTATSKTVPSIASGDSATVVFRINPTERMQLNVPVSGTVGINCANGDGMPLKFSVTPVSSAMGGVRLSLVDEFTFYTEEAPGIAGANVTLKKPGTNEVVVTGKSDKDGIFEIEIQEGYYALSIDAENHDSYNAYIIVDAEKTLEQEIFMSYQTVTYSWNVEETQVVDEYTIETTVNFDTRVPKPVIIASFPEEKPEVYDVVPVVLTNKGLISAINVNLSLQAPDGYYFEFLHDPSLETLEPQQAETFYARLLPAEPTEANAKRMAKARGDEEQECFYIISKAIYQELCEKYTGKEFVEQLKTYAGDPKCRKKAQDNYCSGSSSGGAGGGVGFGGGGTGGAGGGSYGGGFGGGPFGFQKPAVWGDSEETIEVPVDDPMKFCAKKDCKNPNIIKNTKDAPKLTYKIVDVNDCTKEMKGVATDGLARIRIVVDPKNSFIPAEGGYTYEWTLKNGKGKLLTEEGNPLTDTSHWSNVIYQAPINFPEGTNNEFIETAVLSCKKDGKTISTSNVKISLVRVPVVLTHGLNSGPDTWASMKRRILSKDWDLDYFHIHKYSSFQILEADYHNTHNDSFETNEEIVGTTAKLLIDQMAEKGYAASAVDAIGHSMGGLLTKKYIQNHGGDLFHKVITINTPHAGSQLGNLLCDDRVQEMLSFLETHEFSSKISNNILISFYLQKYNDPNTYSKKLLDAAHDFLPNCGDITKGAVADLRVGGDAINKLNIEGYTDNVKCHAIVSTVKNGLNMNVDEVINDQIYREESDGIVPLRSQMGGLEGKPVSRFDDGFGLKVGGALHMTSLMQEDIKDKVYELLTADIESEEFSNGFKKAEANEYIIPPLVLALYAYYETEKAKDEGSKAAAPKLRKLPKEKYFNIDYNGYKLGDSSIKINVSSNVGGLNNIRMSCIYKGSYLSIDSTAYELELPSKEEGAFELICSGISEDSVYYSCIDTIQFNTFINNSIDHVGFLEDELFVFDENHVIPRMNCYWADKDVSICKDAEFKIADQSIAKIVDGKIIGLQTGQTTLVGTYNGHSCTIPVIVRIDKNNSDDGEGICSTVTLSFKQTAYVTRQAFRGTLKINNGYKDDNLEDFKLNLTITDENGNVAGSDKFQVNPETLAGFEGELDFGAGWTLKAGQDGSATILFIPTKNAAPTAEKKYNFGGSFSYIDPSNGLVVTRQMNPVTLTVKPSPSLDLTYFMQRDVLGDDPLTEVVEPSKEAEFSLLISNTGYGDASNVRFVTSQPEIVENEKDLVIDFDLVGSQLNGKEKTLALGGNVTTDFGTIPARSTAYAQWWLKSSLLGHFTDYNVSATHVTSYDNPDLSLLGDVTIHELIRSLEVTDNGERIVGFMANDIKDDDHTPDVLYLSNGEVKDVTAAKSADIVKTSATEYVLKVTPSMAGWNYGKIADPTYGSAELTGIVRQSDGKAIPLRNFWQTDRTLRDNKDPFYEDIIHFADDFGAVAEETYVLTFTPLPDNILEVEAFENVPDEGVYVSGMVESVNVVFNKTIDRTSFTTEDITLSYQGKRQDSDLIGISTADNRTFFLDLTEVNKLCGNGYYCLTVQTADITDSEGYKGKEGKSASWIVNDASGIDILEGSSSGLNRSSANDRFIYSIDGRLVSADGDTRNLRPGLYIRGSKKIVIK